MLTNRLHVAGEHDESQGTCHVAIVNSHVDLWDGGAGRRARRRNAGQLQRAERRRLRNSDGSHRRDAGPDAVLDHGAVCDGRFQYRSGRRIDPGQRQRIGPLGVRRSGDRDVKRYADDGHSIDGRHRRQRHDRDDRAN